MDALIAGAGLAGCITALSLKRAGATCRLVERAGPRDFGLAASHAHRFRPEDIDACASLVGLPTSVLVSCGRSDLLDLLRRPLIADGAMIWSDRIERLDRTGAGWSAQSRKGQHWRFDRAIDASGPSVALAEMAERATGGRLSVSQLEDQWVYQSWRTRSRAGSGRMVKLDKDTGFALAAPDGGTMIVTLAEPAQLVAAADISKVRVARALGLLPKDLVGTAHMYRGSALARTQAASSALCVGDSLIRTPPRFGDGLRHALVTARCVTQSSVAKASQALQTYAGGVWAGTSIAMAFERGGAGSEHRIVSASRA